MFIDPNSLNANLDLLEEIEKSSLRAVTQAIYDFRYEAIEIFANEKDLSGDIGEDITREALDQMGVSRAAKRLFGKIDYKKARYIFLPDYAIRQALFVDSKAEKDGRTATIQASQTSMIVRQIRQGEAIAYQCELPLIVSNHVGDFLTTTIFVKYVYDDSSGQHELQKIKTICLPNGMLQDRYNPSPDNTIWRAGRNAPSRGEKFRVRLHLDSLKSKSNWRVQVIDSITDSFHWDD